MRSLLLSAAVLALTAPAALAYDPDPALKAAVEAASGPNGFSGVALVDTGDGRPWTYVTGMASLDPARPVTAETRFDIGSINKIMTATAIMQLVEAGKVSLDAPVSTYLPEFPAEAGDKVTVAMLLDHTNGLDEVVFNPAFRQQTAAARNNHDVYAVAAAQPHANAAPGRWSYSNTGYVVAAEVIERVSGQPYEAWLKARVLDPAGMTGAAFSGESAGERAFGYTNGASQGGPMRMMAEPMPLSATPYDRPTPFADRYIAVGAGGMYARAADLAAYARAMMENRLISAESLKTMCTPRTPGPPGPAREGFGSGLGCSISSADGVTTFGHNGGRPGMQADFAFAPTKGAVIVAVTNHDGRAMPMTATLRPILAALPDR